MTKSRTAHHKAHGNASAEKTGRCKDVAEFLDISEATVRRLFSKLEEEEKVVRSRGVQLALSWATIILPGKRHASGPGKT